MTVVWNNPAAILEEATRLAGPWAPIPGAVSPYSVVFTGESQFFRVRQP